MLSQSIRFIAVADASDCKSSTYDDGPLYPPTRDFRDGEPGAFLGICRPITL
jgi:hypothetical protein